MDNFDPGYLLDEYLRSVSTAEDPVLAELDRFTHTKVAYPRMICGHIQGRFLEMVSHMISPESILEIGTFTGYSAICLARGLRPGGKLTTIEINDELREIASQFFSKAGLSDKISLLNGDALHFLRNMDSTFDLAYIDGEKGQYIEYYNLVRERIRPGGFILADNTLWNQKVLEDPSTWDADTRAVHQFNLYVQDDPGVENVILPVRDGISLVRVKR